VTFAGPDPGVAAADILLPSATMAEVDRTAIEGGIAGIALMEKAGRAITRAITARFPPGRVLVLCGPGNNGGDGYVVARRLAAAGWPVRVAALVPIDKLKGDAARAAAAWSGPVAALDGVDLGWPGLVVDALFGAGLTRPVEGRAAAILDRVAEAAIPLVAVDVPSGVDGSTGAIRGTAARARLTVTFACRKPGHVLLPGRRYCGEVVTAPIGIPLDALVRHDLGWRVDTPALWRDTVPRRHAESHKYSFGHAVVVGGPATTTGASVMAATAALRVGAGLVSIACSPDALATYAAHVTAVMTRPVADDAALAGLFGDRRVAAGLFGPGAGVGEATRKRTLVLLAAAKPLVLDADALTSFAETPRSLFEGLHDGCVLTPHAGEFRRIFEDRGGRLDNARAAAEASGAVVVLKGADSIVAAPDGRLAIMADAPPSLATAGSGDVLAGLITGLLAQGLAAFEAAAAGVWIHAAAARRLPPRLIAEDLPGAVPAVLADLGL